MADFTITVQDLTDKVQQELDKAVERALFLMGVNAIEGATIEIGGKGQTDKAIDTGRLRASLSFITPQQQSGANKNKVGQEDEGEKYLQPNDVLTGTAEENTVVVGSNVNYASYVHNGTYKKAARPFLHNGIMSVRDKMQRQVEKVLKGEI